MSTRQTYYCDECGRAKEESNHWFRAVVRPEAFAITTWDTPCQSAYDLHLCSESCAVKAMTKAIGTGK